VIVPVKAAGQKSRLSPLMSEPERRAFALSMFRWVMGAVSKAGLLGSCFVVSSDREVLRLAADLGGSPVQEGSDSGVDSAVRLGMARAEGADEFLVIPSDLPLLRDQDLARVLRLRGSGPRVVVAPSASFDGTNALLFPRSPPFPLSYDRDSFWNHLAGGSRLGLPVGVCTAEGLMFDVDSPDDLRRLAETPSTAESARLAREAAS
jgi:2-phospho-L-lactate guanylyltransferase